jgi:hypothetical protein
MDDDRASADVLIGAVVVDDPAAGTPDLHPELVRGAVVGVDLEGVAVDAVDGSGPLELRGGAGYDEPLVARAAELEVPRVEDELGVPVGDGGPQGR